MPDSPGKHEKKKDCDHNWQSQGYDFQMKKVLWRCSKCGAEEWR